MFGKPATDLGTLIDDLRSPQIRKTQVKAERVYTQSENNEWTYWAIRSLSIHVLIGVLLQLYYRPDSRSANAVKACE